MSTHYSTSLRDYLSIRNFRWALYLGNRQIRLILIIYRSIYVSDKQWLSFVSTMMGVAK